LARRSACESQEAGSGAPAGLPADLSDRFDPVVTDVLLGDHAFRILTVRDPDVLLEAITPEAFAVDERLPYWAELWTSSFALARVCLEEESLTGRTVLELGCGVGLAGIAAARAGATVMLTDYEKDALTFAGWNADTNLSPGHRSRVTLRHWDWRAPGSPGVFDVLLGADIVYERGAFAPLLHQFRQTLAPRGYALLAEPDRAPGRDFFAFAAQQGFVVDTRSMAVERRQRTTSVTIARIRRGTLP
jgi:predicted nicotinamide N-methyase